MKTKSKVFTAESPLSLLTSMQIARFIALVPFLACATRTVLPAKQPTIAEAENKQEASFKLPNFWGASLPPNFLIPKRACLKRGWGCRTCKGRGEQRRGGWGIDSLCIKSLPVPIVWGISLPLPSSQSPQSECNATASPLDRYIKEGSGVEWGGGRREGQDVNSIKIRFIAAPFQIGFPFPFERTTTTLVEAPKIRAKKVGYIGGWGMH